MINLFAEFAVYYHQPKKLTLNLEFFRAIVSA